MSASMVGGGRKRAWSMQWWEMESQKGTQVTSEGQDQRARNEAGRKRRSAWSN